MLVRILSLSVKLAVVFAVAAVVGGCDRNEIITIKYPLIWAGVLAGGPTGEWLWGDCAEFAPPRRQLQLCELRRDITETMEDRAARLKRAAAQPAVCLYSLADRTCHREVTYVMPGGE